MKTVDVLDMLILDITRAASENGAEKRLRTLKDLDRAALILARACSLLLDEQADDAELRRPYSTAYRKQAGRIRLQE